MRWWATAEPCWQQIFLCILTFPKGLWPKRSIVCIQPSLFTVHTALRAAGEEAVSAVLARAQGPLCDSHSIHAVTEGAAVTQTLFSVERRWNNGMFSACVASPLWAVINGTLSCPPINIQPNTSRWKQPTVSAALYLLSIYLSNGENTSSDIEWHVWL